MVRVRVKIRVSFNVVFGSVFISLLCHICSFVMSVLTHERQQHTDKEQLVFLDGHGLNARVPSHAYDEKGKGVVRGGGGGCEG